VTRRVLAAELNRDLLDDKDYYGNKRLELAGQLLSLLFEDLFKRFNADLKRSAELVLQKQNRVNAFDVVKSTHWRTDTVTHGFSHAISTGNWVLKRFKMDRAGVTQVLSRLSYVSAVGMTTRVNSQFEKTRKTSGPRALQPSQWGMLCVAPGTPVLLADGTTLRPLDALEHLVGSKRGAPRIRCVDVHTRKAHASAVTDFQRVDVRRYGRDLLRVTTDAGRSIVVSEDHLFAVAPSTDDEERTYDAAAKEHFLAAGDLTVGLSRVLVMPTPLPEDAPTTSSEEDLGESLLLDRASFLAQASLDRRTEEVSDADLDDASSELEAAGLLPLRRDDSRLEALARLLGWASLAGHCGEREAHFDVCRGGDHADLLETLLNLTPRREDDVVVVVYGSKTTTKIVLSGSLVRLLRVLLAGGKPTTTTVATKKRGENPLLGGGDGVPAFVSSCRRPVKAAFLSGLFGAAGTAPLFRNGRLIPPTVDAPPFVGDLSILLSDLGIDAEQIPSKRKRNDDNDDSGFRLAVEGSDRNVLRFGALVGFAWHTEKQNTLRVVSEYLRSRATFDDVRRSLPPPGRRRRPSSDGVFSSSFQAFEEWRSEVSADCATGTLYDGVARVEEVSPSECPEVCDLTTASEAHTFVANGFVTHNCPADTPEGETCGLVKNLALLAHVTTDAEVDVVLRACFDLGVEQLGHLGGRSLSSSSRTDESRGVSCYLVFLNGLVIGATSRPRKLANALRRTRRSGGIGRFVSVYANDVHRSIFVACDGGRVCRPLVVAPRGRSRLTATILAEALAAEDDDDDGGEEKNGLSKKTTLKTHQKNSKKTPPTPTPAGANMTLEFLIKRGVVEYVDVNEENNCFVALDEAGLTEKHSHLEIDPVAVLGVVSGLVAFPHHNQSPRNTYQCAMGKQAMGVVASNHYSRVDSLLYSLVYPQKPMVKSRVLDLIKFDELPGGCNASLAVMSYSGYDIEDAVVLNKASLDRGFMRCVVMRKHQAAIKRYPNGLRDKKAGPPPASNFHRGEQDARYQRYSALDDDGICAVGEKLRDQFIMINREVPVEDRAAANAQQQHHASSAAGTNNNNGGHGQHGHGGQGHGQGGDNQGGPSKKSSSPGGVVVNVSKGSSSNSAAKQGVMHRTNNAGAATATSYKAQPCTYKGKEESVVDRVVLTANESDPYLVKVVVRQTRRPEVGDKFASRHGQKGVCGAVVPQEDMPFSDAGVCPDLIMNPHGFPSRMTVGKIIELVAGKAGVFSGRQAYGTAFGEAHGSADRAKEACEALVAHGFSYVGKDVFYSGTGGEPLQAYIFNGPVFYQKLKHMVADKMHARARGPRAQLTRQPTEGRSRDGGLRLGEMERDCLISYGAANLITERLMISSDQFDVHVCERCGLLGYSRLIQGKQKKHAGTSAADAADLQTAWCQNCRSDARMARIRIPYACKLLFQELQSMNVTPRLTLEDM